MVKKRNRKVDIAVREALADLIEESADPRLGFVTLTEVAVTQDAKHATVYYSTLDPAVVSRDHRRTGGDRVPEAHEVRAGLDSARARLQSMLSERVRLRNTPQLKFVPDPVVEQASRVEQLLREVREEKEGR